ncbi:MAG: hypothetical protein OEN55_03690 [Alphaproteobacteria bacterium]|nr:hypothetical protein [Alphaproteobacteria bacterium]
MIRMYRVERRKMMAAALVSLAALVLLAAGAPRARADAAPAAGQAGCETAVQLMEGAEKKLGGALYKAPMEGAGKGAMEGAGSMAEM